MDNSSIIDELFARIQSLEDENKNLKTKIGELESDLVKKEGENEENFDQDIEEKKQDNMMIDDIVEEINSVKSITISYIPTESVSKLYIMGDFTNWELIEMTKENSNIFTFNILLLNGFKYFYCFYTDDQPIVDFNNLYEENISNGQIQNVLYLANEDNKFEEYVFNKYKKQWELAKKHYFRKRIGEESDVRLIEDSIARAEIEKIKTDRIILKKSEKINRIKKLYE